MANHLTEPEASARLGLGRPLLTLRALSVGNQRDAQHLRGAVDAEGFFTAETAADDHHRVILVEDTLVVGPAGDAGDKDRANDGKADLAAVGMAAKKQFEFTAGPAELIRRMSKAKTEATFRHLGEFGGRTVPRGLVANGDAAFVADGKLLPAIGENREAEFRQLLPDRVGAVNLVVVAEDGEARFLPFQTTQERSDPSLVLVR